MKWVNVTMKLQPIKRHHAIWIQETYQLNSSPLLLLWNQWCGSILCTGWVVIVDKTTAGTLRYVRVAQASTGNKWQIWQDIFAGIIKYKT